ncbi:MAG: helix-turn-helix domain-containing protein [Acidobacteriaceae bacterium]|jgi:AcrR family transcriptional regulator
MSRFKSTLDRKFAAAEELKNASPSQQAMKSERTRTELLRAAEVVFARDGFEASRIEDIAAEAGRSRGAFYANFANKTEVFLALRSLATRRRARALRERIQDVKDEEERYKAIIHYVVEQICDTQTQLLQIEFKLFALRHPELLADLAEKHLEASTSVNRQELSDLFPEKNEKLAETRCNTLAVEAILEGFALNARFSPRVLDPSRMREIVPELIAQIFHRD